MANIIITSFISDKGHPSVGLTPTIRVWEVNGGDQTLIIGTVNGTNDPGPVGGGASLGTGPGTDGVMIEVFDHTVGNGSGGLPISGDRDGFYKYNFDSYNGYNPTKSYVVRIDGGVSLNANDRYQVTSIEPDVVSSVYNAQATDYLLPGSFGEKFNQTAANTTQTAIDVNDVLVLLDLVLKYQTNRTKINHINKTLTVYDDDCVTVLRTFNLFDHTGAPSITEVCERRPVIANDGRPVCP